MPIYREEPRLSRRFYQFQAAFLQDEGLHFSQVLTEERIEQTFAEAGVEFPRQEDEGDVVYTPAVTLWAFCSQMLYKGEQRSCLAAVSRVFVMLVALGRSACCRNSGDYCRARAKLPEVVIERLADQVAEGCERAAPAEWLWHNRHVFLVDGTTLTMPDTSANQDEYPQNPAQKPGLGFPIVRMVVLLSLATAMVCGATLGPYAGKGTGETALLRKMIGRIEPGALLVADRYYAGFFMFALALLGQFDFVARLHQRRKIDFRKAKRLGAGDWLVRWVRPPRPKWMEQSDYDEIPESLEVRLVDIKVREPGFRVKSLTVVTTLTDSNAYPPAEIADLYRRRWLAELDIRAIKTTMGLDMLRCKTPEMARKEIRCGLLAYNLIRQAMAEAAIKAGLMPRTLSFATAMQAIAASLGILSTATEEVAARLIAAQLASLSQQTVGNRPNRIEPRAVKRRPQPIALLTKPRDEARAELLRGAAA